MLCIVRRQCVAVFAAYCEHPASAALALALALALTLALAEVRCCISEVGYRYRTSDIDIGRPI